MLIPRFCKFYLTLFLLLAAAIFFSGACSAKKIAAYRSTDRPQTQQQLLRVNLNTANAEELERIPYVGPRLAEKIVEHRERYGRFRKAEHLLIIDGVSEKRFHAMRNFITID